MFVIEAAASVTEAVALEDRHGGGEAVAGCAAGLGWDGHGIPLKGRDQGVGNRWSNPQGGSGIMLLRPPSVKKAALGADFFVSYPLLSEYQVQH